MMSPCSNPAVEGPAGRLPVYCEIKERYDENHASWDEIPGLRFRRNGFHERSHPDLARSGQKDRYYGD